MAYNIIFYFSDQQRWDTCGCFGQPVNGRLLFQLAIRGQMPLADIGSFVAGIFFHILAQSLDIRGQHQVIAETACLSGVFSGLE